MVEMETRTWTGNVRELKAVIERNVAQAFLKDESLSAPIALLTFDPFEGPYRLRDAAPIQPAQIFVETPVPETSAQSTYIETPQAAAPEDVKVSFADRIMTFERRLIDEALKLSEGHQGKAAEHLELTYHSFRGLLRKHGLKK